MRLAPCPMIPGYQCLLAVFVQWEYCRLSSHFLVGPGVNRHSSTDYQKLFGR